MKTSELRIGNWVIVHHNDVEIDFITNKEIVGAKGLHLTELKKVKPIPLTEEWLLKFEFEYTKIAVGFNQFRKGILELSITPNGYELFFTYKWVKIEYVHQIQNLYFALTGEELTFKSE